MSLRCCFHSETVSVGQPHEQQEGASFGRRGRAICCQLVRNHIRIHHSEYEFVDFEGDFIAPDNVNMERSAVKAPASPTNRSRKEGKKTFPGPNQTIPAPEKLEPITLQIEN